MSIDNSNWSYNEFLAFVMVYGAEMSYRLSDEELEFIRTRTGIQDIAKIKARLSGISDIEAIEIIDSYKQQFLNTEERCIKAKRDLEELLKTPGEHSQLEKVVVHLIEKLI